MHLENRVGEKLITVLLAMAAEQFQRQRGVKTLGQFAVNIQHTVNTRILGTAARPKQWKVPLNEAGDAINKVSFSNKKTRLFIDNIFHLVDYIFSSPEDAELRDIWRKMLQDYRDALLILQQLQEYTDNDIETFQSKIAGGGSCKFCLSDTSSRLSHHVTISSSIDTAPTTWQTLGYDASSDVNAKRKSPLKMTALFNEGIGIILNMPS
jgi:hypothetical protein